MGDLLGCLLVYVELSDGLKLPTAATKTQNICVLWPPLPPSRSWKMIDLRIADGFPLKFRQQLVT